MTEAHNAELRDMMAAQKEELEEMRDEADDSSANCEAQKNDMNIYCDVSNTEMHYSAVWLQGFLRFGEGTLSTLRKFVEK